VKIWAHKKNGSSRVLNGSAGWGGVARGGAAEKRGKGGSLKRCKASSEMLNTSITFAYLKKSTNLP